MFSKLLSFRATFCFTKPDGLPVIISHYARFNIIIKAIIIIILIIMLSKYIT